ncbi:hypothetical protein BJ166DRAFT_518266 [Pestalotiopsis sp. NC0098]|nr:hypothetical protein BJ166DRAFT_518266 [Pestalotiopsis sp. NC0098]
MDETQQVFRQARESFLAGLPRDEKAAFEQLGSSVTRADLLHSLEQLLTGFGSDKSDRIFQKISSFSDSIKVYFQVIDTVISSHPEVAAIIWGVARFIFQVRCTTLHTTTRRDES